VPCALAQNLAEAGLIFWHLALYCQRTFPDIFEAVPIAGAQEFASAIAVAAAVRATRPRAAEAFLEFYNERAGALYPEAGFAALSGAEFGREIDLAG
jgi:hypothetical protein